MHTKLMDMKEDANKVNNLDKKGQALVEFILILPVFLYLILVIIDFSHIFYVKNDLSGLLNNVVNKYEHESNISTIEDLVKKDNKANYVEIVNDKNVTTIKLYRTIEFISPGLGYFLDSPYNVLVSRVISNG